MSHLRLGNSLDKCVDMGPIVDPSQKKSVDEYVQDAKNSGAEVHCNTHAIKICTICVKSVAQKHFSEFAIKFTIII